MKISLQEAHSLIQHGHLTESAAISICLDRLEDLYEAINGIRPIRPDGESEHVTLVRWMPILADYQMVCKVKDRACELEKEAKIKADIERGNAWQSASEANKARSTLVRLESSLREAVKYLDESRNKE